MEKPPFSPADLAVARSTLTDTALMQQLTPDQREQLVAEALRMLGEDRAWRQNTAPQVDPHGALVILPLALWQAGLRARRIARTTRPVLPPTPGDAA